MIVGTNGRCIVDASQLQSLSVTVCTTESVADNWKGGPIETSVKTTSRKRSKLLVTKSSSLFEVHKKLFNFAGKAALSGLSILKLLR